MSLYSLSEATALIAKGHAQHIVADLVSWTEKRPKDIAARYVLAHAYEAVGQWLEAKAAWQDARRQILDSRADRMSASDQENVVRFQLTKDIDAALDAILAPEYAAESDDVLPHASEDDNELQHLILELESARSVPMPSASDLPAPDLHDDVEGMVSETLARIHVTQGQFLEAAAVYEQLAVQEPEEAQNYRQRAAELRARAQDDGP